MEWTHAPSRGGVGSHEGLPIFNPPYGRIAAICMNRGEHLWWIPTGGTPERIADHVLPGGVDLPNTGATEPRHGHGDGQSINVR